MLSTSWFGHCGHYTSSPSSGVTIDLPHALQNWLNAQWAIMDQMLWQRCRSCLALSPTPMLREKASSRPAKTTRQAAKRFTLPKVTFAPSQECLMTSGSVVTICLAAPANVKPSPSHKGAGVFNSLQTPLGSFRERLMSSC